MAHSRQENINMATLNTPITQQPRAQAQPAMQQSFAAGK
jgi:hypothetical protein